MATPEPHVQVPMPRYYGSPHCPSCGYRCGCCCHCDCQSRPEDYDEDDDSEQTCWGGHEPWDCLSWSTRYHWAKAKSARLGEETAVTTTDAKASERDE